MPQILFKGVRREGILNISKGLVDKLQDVLECPRDYFSLELLNNDFIQDGKIVDGYPIIEIKWFDRGQNIQDKVAMIITDKILNLGYETVDVFFTVLQENKYYENGEHF